MYYEISIVRPVLFHVELFFYYHILSQIDGGSVFIVVELISDEGSIKTPSGALIILIVYGVSRRYVLDNA